MKKYSLLTEYNWNDNRANLLNTLVFDFTDQSLYVLTDQNQKLDIRVKADVDYGFLSAYYTKTQTDFKLKNNYLFLMDKYNTLLNKVKTEYALKIEVPSAVSQLQNDSHYIALNQNITNLKNDANYITLKQVPAGQKDPIYLADKPYIALKSELFSKDYTQLYNRPDLTLKADLIDGLVPASQLPSYVDDIVEFDCLSCFPDIGQKGKIYVSIDNNSTYRWSGTQYTFVSQALTLGQTEYTAYTGSKGKHNAQNIAVFQAISGKLAYKTEIPSAVSQLQNDSHYIKYQDNISDLVNDAAYITTNQVPSGQIDPVYMADKPSIALKSQIPTKLTQLDQDLFVLINNVSQLSGAIPNKFYCILQQED